MAKSTPMMSSLHLDHGFQRLKLYSQYLRKLHAKLKDFWVCECFMTNGSYPS